MIRITKYTITYLSDMSLVLVQGRLSPDSYLRKEEVQSITFLRNELNDIFNSSSTSDFKALNDLFNFDYLGSLTRIFLFSSTSFRQLGTCQHEQAPFQEIFQPFYFTKISQRCKCYMPVMYSFKYNETGYD